MIQSSILARLQSITPEEQAILDGKVTIDRELYMTGPENEINSQKLLADGKLITLRPHTRFIHFPEHTHNYVEVVYACSGETVHLVNGKRIRLHAGELLFLGQNVRHEVFKADVQDVAVNFIVLPEFFSDTLSAIGEESSPLRRFLVDCLFGQNIGPGYLYFRSSEDISIQNLVENLLITLLYETQNRRKISQMTMTLLFLELVGHTERLDWDNHESLILKVLRYIDGHYANGSLTDAANLFHCDISTLSREIRRQTGKTYTELVQEKRLTQAAFLLRSTDRKVEDIALTVGYENISYFHRLFRSAYGMSPRHFRLAKLTERPNENRGSLSGSLF